MPYFRYTLFDADGSDAGEAESAPQIKLGEIVWTSDGRKLRVLDLVMPDEGEYAGLLKVQPA